MGARPSLLFFTQSPPQTGYHFLRRELPRLIYTNTIFALRNGPCLFPGSKLYVPPAFPAEPNDDLPDCPYAHDFQKETVEAVLAISDTAPVLTGEERRKTDITCAIR